MTNDPSPSSNQQKASATYRRHKEERRAERLSQIEAQTADGTLVVRQMTVAQQETATEVARGIRVRNEERSKRKKAPKRPNVAPGGN